MRRLVAAALAALAVLLAPSTVWASEDEPSIAHVEATDDGLRVLVSVPTDVKVELSGVTGKLNGENLDTTAVSAGTSSPVARTAVLAMDTSDSMAHNGRFEAAKAAALTFLQTVPADVAVGIVTFDREVTTALEPTTDRSAAQTVVEQLELSKGTLLYDGILAAVDLAGADGQRSILVLSDGADTGSTAALSGVSSEIAETATLVDVVALDQKNKPKAEAALTDLAEAGQGQVIASTGEALADAFEAEADVLARQVLVTAPLPAGFDAEAATVSVTLPTPDGDLVASAFAKIQDAPEEETGPTTQPIDPSEGWQLPTWALYAGILVFGLGVLATAILLVPGKPQPMSIADRVTAYTGGPAPGKEESRRAAEPMLDQAKAAAAGVLHRNKGMEERLATKLTAAGSGFKPSEWLLLQIGVAAATTVLGLLAGRGNVIIALVFLLFGLFIPRVYLRFQTGRRRKAFDAALPETLQLMSGSLAAGLSLPQSVDTIVNEGPEPIASEFKRVLVETRIGLPLEDAFDGVAERFQSKDFAWVVMAIRIQRQVGGNLAELLTTVSDTMRERQYLRRQVRSLSAEGRFSAYILGALPPAFLVFEVLTNPDYIMPLFTEPLGIALLAAATVWLGIGMFWMSRLVKVEV